MASSSSSLLILAVACFVSLISPTISKTCSSQNILYAERTPFETCLDLPVLDSFLHYTYNASNSSLSVAFVATPSHTNGWVAWAINPTATGMSGSQAFLSYRSENATPVVRTYNITAYNNLYEGKLAFDFWNVRAESTSGGRIAIFTTVKVPAGADRVNQVWQIGGNVSYRPGPHPFTGPNLKSTAVLRFNGDAPSPGPAPNGGGSTTPGQAGSPGNAGSKTTSVNFGVNLVNLVLLGCIFIF